MVTDIIQANSLKKLPDQFEKLLFEVYIEMFFNSLRKSEKLLTSLRTLSRFFSFVFGMTFEITFKKLIFRNNNSVRSPCL